MNKPTPMPPIPAHLADRYAWPFIQPAEHLSIEPRLGIDIECRTAQRHQRRNGCIDVDDRRPVQRQFDALVVFILPYEAELLTCRRYEDDHHDAHEPPESHNPK